MKGSCDSMPHLSNESFLTKEQQDRLKGTFDDFVAVVRCKDCKHYKDGFCYNPNTYDDEKTRGNTVPNWFCADGKRR